MKKIETYLYDSRNEPFLLEHTIEKKEATGYKLINKILLTEVTHQEAILFFVHVGAKE